MRVYPKCKFWFTDDGWLRDYQRRMVLLPLMALG